MRNILASIYGFRVTAIAVVSALAMGALAGIALGSRLQEGKTAKIQAAWIQEKASQAMAAADRAQAAGLVTAAVGQKAAETQVRIETRFRTLRERVPVYVPNIAPPGVIRADDRVPVGALVLLDAAARGEEPDAISVASGKSYDLASSLRFSELVGNYVENLGIGHQNAEQVRRLQEWIRGQEAASAP
jgi:hypothetical protein